MIESQLLRFAQKDENFNRKFIVADVESEGLNLFYSRPFEISWLVNDKNKIENYQYFPWFPDMKVSPEAARVNNFNWEYYKKAAIPKEAVCEKLDEQLFNPLNIIIGQNFLGFDCMILNNFRKLCGKKSDYSYLPRVIDTRALCMALHLGIHPQSPIGSLDFLAWQFSLMQRPKDRKMKTSLDYMIKLFGIDETNLPPRHSAKGDNIRTHLVAQQLLWKVNVFVE